MGLIPGMSGLTFENKSIYHINKPQQNDDLNRHKQNLIFISNKCYQKIRTMKGIFSAQ